MLKIKRAYEASDPADGSRILIERLWPRGLRKEAARLDDWLKAAAPSSELRKWFGHQPDRWSVFRERYRLELRETGSAARAAVDALVHLAESRDVTLIYSAHDRDHNSAIVLKDEIERRLAAAAPRRRVGKTGASASEHASSRRRSDAGST